jgi:hypothetical protein
MQTSGTMLSPRCEIDFKGGRGAQTIPGSPGCDTAFVHRSSSRTQSSRFEQSVAADLQVERQARFLAFGVAKQVMLAVQPEALHVGGVGQVKVIMVDPDRHVVHLAAAQSLI